VDFSSNFKPGTAENRWGKSQIAITHNPKAFIPYVNYSEYGNNGFFPNVGIVRIAAMITSNYVRITM
jgi:hypothetical protein